VSQALRRKAEYVSQLIEELAVEVERGIPVIVEGRKDEKALRKLAVNGLIICVKNCRRNLADIVFEIEEKGFREVILLMDFDRRGKEWTKRLNEYFERAKIKSNLRFWRQLRGLVGRELKDVEGLATYVVNLQTRIENS
jgi:5S rRNA maturation endonuclease (ribonuclease M5)